MRSRMSRTPRKTTRLWKIWGFRREVTSGEWRAGRVIGEATHAGAVGRGARMAANKAGRNLRRRNAGSRRAFGGHRRAVVIGKRPVDQPGPGRTGAADRTGAAEGVWEFSEFRPLAVLEDCGGRTRVGDSERSEEHMSELQSRLHLVCRL